MKELLKLAWRNLWRNRKRTIITASSIFFAIFFAIGMRSFQLGTYDHMIRQIIESFSGYLQVQQVDYADDPIIDYAVNINPALMEALRADPNVAVAVPRITSFALASSGELSKGVLVTGIDPTEEAKLSNPAHRLVRYRLDKEDLEPLIAQGLLTKAVAEDITPLLPMVFTNKESLGLDLGFSESDSTLLNRLCQAVAVEGRHLTNDDTGALVSSKLADYLKLNVGDSLVLMGQGFEGSSAAGIFPIRGIVSMSAPDLDNKLIYLSLEAASTFYNLEDRVTSIAINLHNTKAMKATQARLAGLLTDPNLTVKNWETLNPSLKQQIQGDDKSGQVFLFVLYVIIFFGIFGTVQMMLSERQREFGMMVSIGMKRGMLAGVLTIEMLFLGLIGTLSGMLAALPFILLGHYHPLRLTGDLARMFMNYGFDPLMPMALLGDYFFNQAIIIFLMVLLASYLPVRSLLKLDPIKALHGH
ncbi:MAG: ABC transporter permease [Bacteroidales bacterium]|nr:ABC transporter permease [Bacteroidales bacterium]